MNERRAHLVQWIGAVTSSRLVMLAAALGLSACQAADTDLAIGAAVAFDSQPMLDIAGTDPNGTPILSDPVGATRLSTGTIVIADRGDRAVRYFDANGQPTRSVGREGSAPGEFREISWLGQCLPDTIFVWDRMAARMTMLAADGQVVRTYPISPTPTTLDCSVAGIVVFFGPPEELPAPTGPAESAGLRAPLFLMVPTDSAPRQIGTMPVGQRGPLGRVTSLALGAGRLHVGTAESDEIVSLALTGEPQPSLRTQLAPRPATEAHFERAIEIEVSNFRDAAARSGIGQMLRRMPMPELMPAYLALLPDPAGVLWVVMSIPGDSTTWLRGLSTDSELVADLHLPGEVQVFEVGMDYLLGSTEGADGTPHVVQYRLRRQ